MKYCILFMLLFSSCFLGTTINNQETQNKMYQKALSGANELLIKSGINMDIITKKVNQNLDSIFSLPKSDTLYVLCFAGGEMKANNHTEFISEFLICDNYFMYYNGVLLIRYSELQSDKYLGLMILYGLALHNDYSELREVRAVEFIGNVLSNYAKHNLNTDNIFDLTWKPKSQVEADFMVNIVHFNSVFDSYENQNDINPDLMKYTYINGL